MLQVPSAISREFVPVLSMLSEDETLSYSYSSVREAGLRLLSQLDSDAYNLFSHAQQMCQAFKSTCSFLMEFDNLVRFCVSFFINVFHDTVNAIQFLHFHCYGLVLIINMQKRINRMTLKQMVVYKKVCKFFR